MVIVIYRKNETILILISSKRYVSHPKISIPNFKEALQFWAQSFKFEILATRAAVDADSLTFIVSMRI